MAIRFKFLLILIFFLALLTSCFAQDYQMHTLFNGSRHASGGYGAISNKFTRINGHFANLAEVYGGWYVNHRFLLGVSGAAVTNNIPVAPEFSAQPGLDMSYEYGQCGLITEYTLWANRAIHFSFEWFNGAGFTVQYYRPHYHDDSGWDDLDDHGHDTNWFYVTEPGLKLEMNVLRWMRFSPGVSYRAAFGSQGKGLSDNALSAMNVNLTLKFGHF